MGNANTESGELAGFSPFPEVALSAYLGNDV